MPLHRAAHQEELPNVRAHVLQLLHPLHRGPEDQALPEARRGEGSNGSKNYKHFSREVGTFRSYHRLLLLKLHKQIGGTIYRPILAANEV